MERQYTDDELDSLLDDAPADDLSDDYLDSLLGAAPKEPQAIKAPPTLFRDLGFEGSEQPEQPAEQRYGGEVFGRAAVGMGAALGELVSGSLTLVQKAVAAPLGPAGVANVKPLLDFDRREFVRRFEKAGLLHEANLVEKAAQFVGEGAVDFGSMIAAGGALKAAGLPTALANTIGLVGTMTAQMQAQASAQGKSAPSPQDLGIGLAVAAGSYGLGMGAAQAIIKGVSKLRPLSKLAQDLIGNATTGLMFEVPGATGVIPGVPRDPDWKARLLAAVPAMAVVNVHGATFDGEARARTKADLSKQMQAAVDLANQVRPLERYPTFTPTGVEGGTIPGSKKRVSLRGKQDQVAARYMSGMDIGQPAADRPTLDAAQRVAILQAEALVKNVQVGADGKAGVVPDAAEIEAFFNIPRHEAERISKLKPSAGEKAEILESRRIEAAMEQVPPEIQAEVRYRAKLMEPEERALYEAVRRDPPVEQVPEIEAAVERVGRPLGELLAEPVEGGMGGFKVRPKPGEPLVTQGEPGPKTTTAVSPDLGEARPAEPIDLALRGEPGPTLPPHVSPDLGEAPSRSEAVNLALSGPKGPRAKAAVSPDLGEGKPQPGVELAARVKPTGKPSKAVQPDLENVGGRQRDPLIFGDQSPGKASAESAGGKSVRNAMDVLENVAAKAKERRAAEPPGEAEPAPGVKSPTQTRPRPATPEAAAAEVVVETASIATNAEVAATTKKPAEIVSRTKRAADKAKAILGEKAQKPLPAPAGTKKTKKPKAKAQAEIDAELDAAVDAIQERANRNERLRPRLTPEEAADPFWSSPKGKATIAGAAAGTALAAGALSKDDDDLAAKVALAVGFPALAFMRRGRATPFSRWSDRITVADAERRASVREAVAVESRKLVNNLFYTGKGGPRATERDIQDLARAALAPLQDTPVRSDAGLTAEIKAATERKAKPRTDLGTRLNANDPLVGTALGKLGRLGPAGKATEELVRGMLDEVTEHTGDFDYEHSRVATGPFKDNPSVDLHGEKKDWMNDFMDWQHAPDMLPQPDMAKIQDPGWEDVARRVAIQVDAYRNKKSGDADVAQMSAEANDWYNQYYAGQAARAAQQLEPFHTRMTVNGQYRPQFMRPEMFDPPEWMRLVPGGMYDKKLRRAHALQEAAAATAEGGPIDIFEFREMLREMQKRGYAEGRMFDAPLEDIIAGKNTHLDFHRMNDLRVGIDWDPASQANRYQESTSRRLALAENFGGRAEIAQTLRAMAVKDGYDGALFTDLFDLATGGSPRVTDPGPIGRAVRSAATLTSLPKTAFSALVQPVQWFTPALQVGIKRTIASWPDMIRASVAQSTVIPKSMKESRAIKRAGEFTARAGASINHTFMQDARGAHGPVRKLAARHYRLNLMTTMDRSARNLGKIAGASMFDDLMDSMQDARRRGMEKEFANYAKQIDEIFREQPTLAAEAKKSVLEPGQREFLQRRAAIIIDRKINFRTLPADMPTLYSNPVGRTLYNIGTYTYQAQRAAHDLLRQVWTGTNTQRLRILYGLGFATIGSGLVYATRDAMLRRDKLTPEESDSLKEFISQYVVMSALQGFVGPAYVDGINDLRGKYGNPAVNLAGPFWSEVVGGAEALKQTLDQESKDPLLRYGIRVSTPRPVGKKLAEKVAPPKSRKKKQLVN